MINRIPYTCHHSLDYNRLISRKFEKIKAFNEDNIMATIITNMNRKVTPDYNSKNGTAKELDENGIVQIEEGTVARTDNLDIVFTDKPSFTAQSQSD